MEYNWKYHCRASSLGGLSIVGGAGRLVCSLCEPPLVQAGGGGGCLPRHLHTAVQRHVRSRIPAGRGRHRHRFQAGGGTAQQRQALAVTRNASGERRRRLPQRLSSDSLPARNGACTFQPAHRLFQLYIHAHRCTHSPISVLVHSTQCTASLIKKALLSWGHKERSKDRAALPTESWVSRTLRVFQFRIIV